MKINLYTYIHITTNKFISENNNFQEYLTTFMQLKFFIKFLPTNIFLKSSILFYFLYYFISTLLIKKYRVEYFNVNIFYYVSR